MLRQGVLTSGESLIHVRNVENDFTVQPLYATFPTKLCLFIILVLSISVN